MELKSISSSAVLTNLETSYFLLSKSKGKEFINSSLECFNWGNEPAFVFLKIEVRIFKGRGHGETGEYKERFEMFL